MPLVELIQQQVGEVEGSNLPRWAHAPSQREGIHTNYGADTHRRLPRCSRRFWS